MDVFVHHYNDMSGSPRIINTKIREYLLLNRKVALVTNSPLGLIDCDDIEVIFIPYKKRNSKVLQLLGLIRFWWFAAKACNRLLRDSEGIVHASTLINAPVLLLTNRRHKRVVHVMEYKVSPASYRQFLLQCAKLSSARVVFLSKFLKEMSPKLSSLNAHVTYPCVDSTFYKAAPVMQRENIEAKQRLLTVTLICSHVWFKGYEQFIALAYRLPKYKFCLVLNGNEADFYSEYLRNELPPNLTIEFNVSDIARVMAESSIVLSLTHRDRWVETFALTLAEAMASGCPVIAPDIGAQTEYIVNGRNGYLINEMDLEAVEICIVRLLTEQSTFESLAREAKLAASAFSSGSFTEGIQREIEFVESQNDAAGDA